MKVLIVSMNSLPAAPTGPAYIAGAALRDGHSVEVFECLFSENAPADLISHLERFQPDVIGISIRLVHAYILDETAPYHTRHQDLRPAMKKIVTAIRQTTSNPIVLGGPGFNYFAQDWLEYLDLDYGIRGEADIAFPLYLKRLAKGGDLATIPGSISRQNGQFHKEPRHWVENLDDTAFPAYQLLDLASYQQHGISPGILTKRGCAFRCIYCPYHALEGGRYRIKSPARIVDEIEHIQKLIPSNRIVFCENNFNVPRNHAEAICQEILARRLEVRWGTGDLRPRGVTEPFCQLMHDSGCDYLNLSLESGSDLMLKRMRRGYTARDVEESFDNLERSGIPYGASLMFGAPGETPETIRESLALVDRHPAPLGTWVTIGICLWTHHQQVISDARNSGQLEENPGKNNLFEGANYLSPDLPRSFMEELIESLRAKPGFSVQVNHPYAGYR